jgi:4-hydroxy-tetrahydrodipicolinate synthase
MAVFPAAITPLDRDLEPATDLLCAHARELLAVGCGGVLVLGTTGEAASLSLAARMRIVEAVGEAGLAPRAIIGTGACSLDETVRLTRLALEVGCPRVLVLPPYYYKGVSDDGLFDYFAMLVERVDDPDLRLHLYHFPAMAVICFSYALIGRLRAAFGEVIAGIKDSSGDRDHTLGLVERFPELAVYAGTERLLLEVVERGGAGCISATANVTAALAARLLETSGAERVELSDRLAAARAALEALPVIAAMKQLYAWRMGDEGLARVLPPLRPLSAEEQRILRATAAEHALLAL